MYKELNEFAAECSTDVRWHTLIVKQSILPQFVLRHVGLNQCNVLKKEFAYGGNSLLSRTS